MSVSKRETVYNMFGGKCAYCGEGLNPFQFHIDHIKPVCQGGKDKIWNYVPACRSCNIRKGGRTPDQWRQARAIKSAAEYAEEFGDDGTEHEDFVEGIEFYFEYLGYEFVPRKAA